jgi:hypothetical protein
MQPVGVPTPQSTRSHDGASHSHRIDPCWPSPCQLQTVIDQAASTSSSMDTNCENLGHHTFNLVPSSSK